ncbi:hypothetical protein C8R43DRAFT_1238863 [Mycena crocata]|nr:hypothetical protein C8R43DRAFT_1238863 [Mycena crocata]
MPLPVTGAVGILLRHRRRSHATRRAAAANVVLDANPASRLSVLVIAASPPPPPATTSTPAQPFNRLRNVSFSSIPPFSSSGWRHNVFKPSSGLIFLPLSFLPVPSHFGAPIQIQAALTPYLHS